jgi:transposase InsO family protein
MEIISDNRPTFISAKLTQFLNKFGVKHFTSFAYYPEGNGQVESTNKNMVKILKIIIEDKPASGTHFLTYALWAYHTTTMSSTGFTPF